MTPGLVDPHKHIVYYGDGLTDFELLTQGGTRAQMIAAGGGVGARAPDPGGERGRDLCRPWSGSSS